MFTVRVDAVSGEVMNVARLTISEIESEMLRLHKLRPNMLLGRLAHLLRIISRLPPNKYLMRHLLKSGNKVMVYVHSEAKYVLLFLLSENCLIQFLITDPTPASGYPRCTRQTQITHPPTQ